MSAAMVLGGTSVVPAKILAGNIPVFTIHFLSLAAALLFLLPFSARSFRKIGKREMLLCIMQAASGIIIFRIFLVLGLNYISGTSAGFISSTAPAFLTLFSVLFLKEKLSSKKIITVIIVVSGLVLLNLDTGSSLNPGFLTGFVFIIISVIGEAGLTLFRKLSSGKIPAHLNAFILTLISTLFFAPLSIAEIKNGALLYFNTGYLFALLYYGIIATGLAYILWGNAAPKIRGSTIAVCSALLPAAAVTSCIIVLGEKLFPFQIIGGLLILTGIIFCSADKPDILLSKPSNKISITGGNMQLSDMPNIGTELERLLTEAGIYTPDDLVKKGSVETCRLLNLKGPTCYNKLYALEGAILGIRWHLLPKEHMKKLQEEMTRALQKV